MSLRLGQIDKKGILYIIVCAFLGKDPFQNGYFLVENNLKNVCLFHETGGLPAILTEYVSHYINVPIHRLLLKLCRFMNCCPFQNNNKLWPDTVLDKATGMAHLCSVVWSNSKSRNIRKSRDWWVLMYSTDSHLVAHGGVSEAVPSE